MCRWAAWIGKPLFLQDVFSTPEHSLIVQSQHATECKTAINGDGFGVAWYAHKETPGLFRDVNPAWSDSNLPSIAEQIRAPVFLAHVRATTGTAISRNNCHPFVVGKWSFMHNGQVGGFARLRKAADMRISDDLYEHRKGATDSEAIFLCALGYGLDQDPINAMLRAVTEMEQMSREAGDTPHMRCSAAFSDGRRLFALRYSSDDKAPSLYYRWCDQNEGFLVVSEPLDTVNGEWIEVAPSTLCCFEGQSVTQIEITRAGSVPELALL